MQNYASPSPTGFCRKSDPVNYVLWLQHLSESLTAQVKEEIRQRTAIATHISSQSSEYGSIVQDMKAMSDKVRHASVNTSVHSRASMGA